MNYFFVLTLLFSTAYASYGGAGDYGGYRTNGYGALLVMCGRGYFYGYTSGSSAALPNLADAAKAAFENVEVDKENQRTSNGLTNEDVEAQIAAGEATVDKRNATGLDRSRRGHYWYRNYCIVQQVKCTCDELINYWVSYDYFAWPYGLTLTGETQPYKTSDYSTLTVSGYGGDSRRKSGSYEAGYGYSVPRNENAILSLTYKTYCCKKIPALDYGAYGGGGGNYGGQYRRTASCPSGEYLDYEVRTINVDAYEKYWNAYRVWIGWRKVCPEDFHTGASAPTGVKFALLPVDVENTRKDYGLYNAGANSINYGGGSGNYGGASGNYGGGSGNYGGRGGKYRRSPPRHYGHRHEGNRHYY